MMLQVQTLFSSRYFHLCASEVPLVNSFPTGCVATVSDVAAGRFQSTDSQAGCTALLADSAGH